ncbi:phosphotransferase [Roseovarius bejariae]|uniref:phosphotransferase n=1 Tax=Roseovarius bejariae TaxID=2576383 RepID=UPI001562C141
MENLGLVSGQGGCHSRLQRAPIIHAGPELPLTVYADSSVIAALTRDLADSGQLPTSAQWQRLYGGRTNHVWRVTGGSDAGPVVVKLYKDSADNPLFPNCPEDEARVLRALEGQGMAPRLLHYTATRLGPCLIYSHLDGGPWRNDPAAAAVLLRRLHRTTALTGLRSAPDGSKAIEAQIETILARCAPSAPEIPRLPAQPVAPSGATCLLHGDPVPGNLIDCGTTLRLIDWQCPAIGDPCEDIALFLSPAMQIAYRGAPLTPAEEMTFLKSYDLPEILSRYTRLAPWYHARSYAYALWQSAQGETTAIARAQAERTAFEIALERLKKA